MNAKACTYLSLALILLVSSAKISSACDMSSASCQRLEENTEGHIGFVNYSMFPINITKKFLSIFNDFEGRIDQALKSSSTQRTEVMNSKLMVSDAQWAINQEMKQAFTQAAAHLEENLFPSIFKWVSATMVALSTYAYLV